MSRWMPSNSYIDYYTTGIGINVRCISIYLVYRCDPPNFTYLHIIRDVYSPWYYQCTSAGKFGKRRSYITNTITHVLVLCTSVIHTIWYKSFHIYYKVYLSKNKKSIRPPFRSSCRIYRSAQRLVLCNIVHVYSIPSGSTTHPNDLIWCCMFIGMKLLSFFVVIST